MAHRFIEQKCKRWQRVSDNPDVTDTPEVTEHWMYQGRQQHGWFGSGTAPPRDVDKPYYDFGTLFDPSNIAKRVDYVASLVIGHLPRRD